MAEDPNTLPCVQTSVQHLGDLIITTTTRIERGTATSLALEEADVSPPFLNLPRYLARPVHEYREYHRSVPHPRTLQPRPGMQNHQGKYYVIFRGREVGIFYDA
ncbi:hypothetical protein VNI00_006276 [Paramarasmius palmivorus]|uniref:Uncharacterized protein n=1 Tax=Paramarasmius palmivorus TaxID=297713 RepID=A0AAW0D5Q4_9AGAR